MAEAVLPAIEDQRVHQLRVLAAPLAVELGTHETPTDGPAAFRLVGVAPNPFHEATAIRYELPREAPVAVRVYDVAGRLVATLLDGLAPAGRHETVWRGVDAGGEPVASGIYFCRMETDSFRDEKKLLLIK